MKKLKNYIKKLHKDERGQGMAEYVLLLVIVVGLIFFFRKEITSTVQGKIGEVTGKMSEITPE